MADLSPNLSPYQALSKPGGFGAMDPSSLLGIIQRGRDLSTQAGIAQAIRDNPNDPQAAYSAAASNPNVFLGPNDQSAFANAAAARFSVNRDYYRETAAAYSSLLSKDHPTLKDWHVLTPGLVHMGIPISAIEAVERTADPRTGEINKDAAVTIQQYIGGGQGLPTVGTINPETQQPEQVPAGTLMHRQAQQPGSVGSSGAIGAYPTQPPPFQASTQKGAAEAQQSLQLATTDEIPTTRSLLSNMMDLSREAAAGPGANWQTRWSSLMNGLGLPQFATMSPSQVASSENFEKIAQRLVNQMATTGGHVTNDFLHNAYGSTPSLEKSRQGREGMISWLQGMVDAKARVAQNWQDWLSKPENTGKEGQFYDWSSGKVAGGMDMKNFDMRVFQFEHMSPDEQDKFLDNLKSTPGKYEQFLTHHKDYASRGWLADIQR